MVSAVGTVWVVLVLAESQQGVHIPWAPHWVPISVTGFNSPSLGDGLSTGPMMLWMENAETVDAVLVCRFIYKEYIWGTHEINCRIGKERKGLYNKQEQS